MRRVQITVTAIAVVTFGVYIVRAQQAGSTAAQPLAPGIEWAYGYRVGPPLPANVPGEPSPLAKATPDTLMRVPGSSQAFPASTFDRPNDGSKDGDLDIADWYPEDRGNTPIPAIVRRGRKILNPDGTWNGKEGVRACGQCHLSNGAGRNENSQPGGHSKAYILQQLEDFRNDLRNSADPKKENTHRMTSYAKLMTPEETEAAAEFFSSLPYPPPGTERYVRVVETDMVPVARASGGMFNVVHGAGEEPIGARIIEVPEDPIRTGLRDGKSGFIAYVPVGSIKKGEALVTEAMCALCHGPGLDGTPIAPTIAGRAASYLARELYDLQTGARHGKLSSVMKPVVAAMTTEDIRNIVAYVTSVVPQKRRE